MSGAQALIRALRRVKTQSGRSWDQILKALVILFKQIMGNPQVAELLRFIFLGTIVET
jgi:hypothetical protein